MATSTVTALLAEPADDRRELMGRLMPLVYGELQRMAHRRLAREGGPRTLDTTGLVHEAYLKLVDSTVPLRNRRYFFGAAARVVECRFFGGLGVEETGEVLDVSPTTVKRDWALAEAWLKRELAGSTGS